MSTFKGGPADGVSLMLRSAPRALRVTFNPRARKHPWDALDQEGDEPKDHELLYLYLRIGTPFPYNISARGKGASEIRGIWTDAKYVYCDAQLTDELMRDPATWADFLRGFEKETK